MSLKRKMIECINRQLHLKELDEEEAVYNSFILGDFTIEKLKTVILFIASFSEEDHGNDSESQA